MQRLLIVAVLWCVIGGAAEAAVCRGVGIRDAAAASYSAARRVEQSVTKWDRVTDWWADLLHSFRRQGWVEVEVRRLDRPLFSVRVYLPPPETTEGR